MNCSDYNLKGLCILNTRPTEQSKRLSKQILTAGGTSVELPSLIIQATDIDWFTQLPLIDSIHQAIFTSPNAVHFFFNVLEQKKHHWPQKITIIAVGHATSAALADHHIRVHHLPTIADSEHLINLDTLARINNEKILLVKGIGGRTLIAETLKQRGAELYCVNVYQRINTVLSDSQTHSLWQNNKVDIILFSSKQGMLSLFEQLDEQGKSWLRNKPCFVMSERLANEARMLGITRIFVSNYDNLLQSFHDYNQGLIYAR